MAFTTETGLGLSSSNAYVTVEEADEYFLDRNVTEWAAATEDEKKAAIVNATSYIDIIYGHRIAGDRISVDQALIFPTSRFEGIPLGLKKATFELAVYSLNDPLFVRKKPSDNPLLSEEFKKIGPLEKRLVYKTQETDRVQIPAVDALMRCFYSFASQGGVYR